MISARARYKWLPVRPAQMRPGVGSGRGQQVACVVVAYLAEDLPEAGIGRDEPASDS